jgi:RNA 2',3'-cyclic 3'-phosphodiesterase
MPRLFVAIDLPEQIKAELAGLVAELPAAKWVDQQELHLTLRFIGEVDEQSCRAVQAALAGIAFTGFSLTLRGVGHFPPGKHPRVLWVGIEPSQQLLHLQQRVELMLTNTGIPADERHFSPHMTLARLKETPPAEVGRFETRHAELAFPPFEVKEFILFSSTLTRQGAIHHKEAVYCCRDEPLLSR